jgi:hypothetical protein
MTPVAFWMGRAPNHGGDAWSSQLDSGMKPERHDGIGHCGGGKRTDECFDRLIR